MNVVKTDGSNIAIGLTQVAQLPSGFWPPYNVSGGAYLPSYGSGPTAIRITSDGKIYISVTNANTAYVSASIVYRIQRA